MLVKKKIETVCHCIVLQSQLILTELQRNVALAP